MYMAVWPQSGPCKTYHSRHGTSRQARGGPPPDRAGLRRAPQTSAGPRRPGGLSGCRRDRAPSPRGVLGTICSLRTIGLYTWNMQNVNINKQEMLVASLPLHPVRRTAPPLATWYLN